MKPRAILTIAVKGVKLTIRDRMALFWLIAFPVMMLAIGSELWIPKSRSVITLNIGIVYNDPTINVYSHNATTIVEAMNNTLIENKNLFNVNVYFNESDVINAVKKRDLDAALVFPSRFSQNLTSGLSANLNVYIYAGDPQRLQVVKAILGGFLEGYSEKVSEVFIEEAVKYTGLRYKPYLIAIASPINATVSEVSPEAFETREKILGWFTIGMVGVQFLFAGLSAGATAVTEEKERGTLRRILAAPISPWDLLIGKTLEIVFGLMLTALVCIFFGLTVLGATIIWNPFMNPAHALIPVVLLLAAFTMIGMGFIISIVGKTTKGAAGLATAISFPLMFLTGLYIPKWLLPAWLQVLADISPLTWAVDVVRDIMVYGKGLSDIASVVPSLAIITVATYALGAAVFKWKIQKLG